MGSLFAPEAVNKFNDTNMKFNENTILIKKDNALKENSLARNVSPKKVDHQQTQDKQFMRELIFVFQGIKSKYFVYFDNERKFQLNETLCGKVSTSKKQMI